MTRVNFKNSVIALAIGLVMVSCGGRGDNQQSRAASTSGGTQSEAASTSGGTQLKFDINKESKTFRIIDAQSGNPLSYKKIIIDDKEVIGTNYFMEMVIFYFKNDENIGFRGDSKKSYQLEDGVLIILTETSGNATVKKTEEKPTIKFNGGTCVHKSVDYSSEEKRFSVILHYTLDENASTTALTILAKGVIETSEGKTYKLKESSSNSEYSLYKLDYHFPDAIRKGMSFKYVLNGQEIPIPIPF